MPEVKIKLGTNKHTEWENGKAKVFLPGETLTVSEETFRAFRSKFELVGETETPPETPKQLPIAPPDPLVANEDGGDQEPFDIDVPNEQVSVVMAAVEAGKISPQEALEAENTRSSPRVSLVRRLTVMIEEGENNDSQD